MPVEPLAAGHLPRLLLGNSRLQARGEAEWYAAGGRGFDTARIYGGGRSEALVGDWLRRTGIRDARILTKACHHDVATGIRRLTPADLQADLRESLDLLGVERVAVVLLHRDDPDQPAEEIVDWLGRVVDEGRAEAVGVSNWRAARIATGTAKLAHWRAAQAVVDELITLEPDPAAPPR